MTHRTRTGRQASAALLCLFSISFMSPAQPAAAWLTESGGADMAMASAGRAALAADATTVAANPAGMSSLPGNQLAIAVLPARLDLEFAADDPSAGSASNSDGVTPLGSIFLVHTDGRVSWGLGVHSYLGLGFDYGDDWTGSRMIQEAHLGSLNVTPAVSWRATDDVDIGVSLNAQRADAEVAMGVSNDAQIYGPPVGMADGQLRLDGDSWALGANIGVMYRPDAATRLGLTWTSGTSHDMDLEVDAVDLHPVLAAMLTSVGTPQLKMSFPQQVLLSGVRQLTPATSIAASIAWQDWSSFGESQLQGADLRAPIFPAGLDDAWHVSMGVRHQLTRQWTIASGVAYDTDPAGGNPMPVYFPVSDQLRAALGLEYRPWDELTFRLSYSMLNQGAVRVDPQYHPLPLPGMTAVSGEVASSRMHAIGIAFERRW